jgi:Uma2 family endonuclease
LDVPAEEDAVVRQELLTAEAFIEQREELPDGGQWVELVEGQVKSLSPPSVEHGTAVLNLGKALARCVQAHVSGYPCFELGLLTRRNPDTVLFPAVSFFASGPMFAETDKAFSEARPALIVEMASSNDRRRQMERRVADWLAWGTSVVWVPDPDLKQVHVVEQGRGGRRLGEGDELIGGGPLSGFRIRIAEIFQAPAWATR